MPTNNKGLEQPANGSNVDTWDVPVNGNFGIIDEALGGISTLTQTTGTHTLAIGVYRTLILQSTVTLTGNVRYNIPSGVGGQWIVRNATSGNFTFTIGTTAGGTTVAVPQGQTRVVFSDGPNIREAVSVPTEIPSGTAMLFAQTTAPTGWTKSTTHDNKALRVVSGAASSGGSVAFTTAFASQSISGTVGGTTLTIAQMPAHSHRFGTTRAFDSAGFTGAYIGGGQPSYQSGPHTNTDASDGGIENTGSGEAHTHTFTGTAINLAVAYVDVIIATKD